MGIIFSGAVLISYNLYKAFIKPSSIFSLAWCKKNLVYCVYP